MILADWEIVALCEGGMVTPFERELVNPASLDVRLGGALLIESAESEALVPYPLDRHSEANPYVLTLELHNSRQLHAVGLWPGMKIGQMVFHRMSATPLRDYLVTGRYNGDQQVTASKG
ncbi:MAG: hypothetical protein EBR33_10810 [Synechococcaceae bacterium WB4_1_0192]|nr:hypothetical protein [Synechococcaceae bacterium WB4_1_0192]